MLYGRRPGIKAKLCGLLLTFAVLATRGGYMSFRNYIS